MLKTFLLILFAVLFMTLSTKISYSQTTHPISVSLNQSASEQKLVTINVPTLKEKRTYLVLYFLDGKFVEEFKNQTLPFSFEQNLTGQLGGVHKIRIDIEDGNDKILATGETTINVP